MVAVVVFDLAAAGSTSSACCRAGCRRLTIPRVELADLPILVGGAFGIAIVSLADTISTSSAFATRSGQDVDANQEMVGIGAANVGGRAVPGVPGQHERLAELGRGAGRREDAADRRDRRGRHRA